VHDVQQLSSDHPSVWAVVLNWNGLRDTARCLRSLRASSLCSSLSTVVVDNHSATGEADELAEAFPWVVVLPQARNLGYAGGCNVGIEYALSRGADYVLLLNNDAQVEVETIALLVAHCEGSPQVAAAGPLITFPESDEVWSAGSRVSLWLGSTVMIGKGTSLSQHLRDRPRPAESLPGACLLLRAAALRQVGLLDERFFAYWEDVDICARLRRAGWDVHLVPTARATHRKSASSGASGNVRLPPLASYYIARNAFRFADNNLDGLRRRIFVGAQLLVRLPVFVVRKVAPEARRHYLRGVFDGLRRRHGEYTGWMRE